MEKTFTFENLPEQRAIRKYSVLFESHWFVHTIDWIHIVPDWSNYPSRTTGGTAAVLVSLSE